MVIFNGDQVNGELSLSHKHAVSSSRVSAWMPSYRTCGCVESLSRGGFEGRGRSCETHWATLRRQCSHRLVLTPGKRCGVFTYGRTSTCNFLLRFGLLSKMSFHYLWVPHRCFGGFRAVFHEGLGSEALLCCWWLFSWTLNGFTGVFIWDQIAICLGPWSLYKPDRQMKTVWICVEVMPIYAHLICKLCKFCCICDILLILTPEENITEVSGYNFRADWFMNGH